MAVLLIIVQSVLFPPGEYAVFRQEVSSAKCVEYRDGLMTAYAPPEFAFSFHCLPK